MKVKCDIMGEQLRKALGINSNLTESYQKLRDDCLRTNEANKTLEQANAALTA